MIKKKKSKLYNFTYVNLNSIYMKKMIKIYNYLFANK